MIIVHVLPPIPKRIVIHQLGTALMGGRDRRVIAANSSDAMDRLQGMIDDEIERPEDWL